MTELIASILASPQTLQQLNISFALNVDENVPSFNRYLEESSNALERLLAVMKMVASRVLSAQMSNEYSTLGPLSHSLPF